MKRSPTLLTRVRIFLLAFSLVIVALCVAVPMHSTRAVAQVLPPGSTRLSIHSEPGDPWSATFGKSDWFYSASDSQFVTFGGDRLHDGSMSHVQITVHANNGESWTMFFDANGPLAPGDYDGGIIGGSPPKGLTVFGLGRSCTPSDGKFTVLDVAHTGSANFITVTRFAARFEYHCYGLEAALTGSVYYNSNGFPPPTTLVMKDRPPMPDAVVGVDYIQTAEAEGGTPPYTWQLDTGQLPPGLVLDINGTIHGVPTTRGRYLFRMMVADSAATLTGWPVQIASKDFSIQVNPAGFTIDDGLPPTALKNVSYAYQFVAIGGQPPYQWSLIDGQIPTGLSLDKDGKLTGVPTSIRTFTFSLRAVDSADHQSERTYAIGVIDPPVISSAKYKVAKGKLLIYGTKFDETAVLFLDGQETKPKNHDTESFVLKGLSLTAGPHVIRIVNPDGGTASATILVE